jgi:aminoglycoside 6'-N-acetyltransferase I
VTAQNSLVRFARPSDCERLAKLRQALWPEGSLEERRREVEDILRGKTPGAMPLVEFVWEEGGALLGFIEAGLRSHADECDPARPVGYVEGWYVVDGYRRKGIGAALLRAAEDWSRRQGCKEIASDALIENELSQRAHEALGFQVVGRNVLYRKKL